MKRLPTLVLGLGLLTQPLASSAQIVDYVGGPLGAQEYLDFVGGSGVNSTWSGHSVGLYRGRFMTGPGGTVTSANFSVICVDFDHWAGDHTVNVNGLSSAGFNGAETRVGTLKAYQQAAYLASFFDVDYGSAGARQTAWSGIHAAIWTLIRGALPTPGGALGGTTYALRDAYLSDVYARSDAELVAASSGWVVLSPSELDPGNKYSGQEFLMRTTTTPEPSTWLLLGTGLLFIAFFGRRRMKELAEG